MIWISRGISLAALLFATINAVQFYGDNSCSCSEDQCCDDNDYNCICFADDDSSIIIELTSPLPFYGQNYTYVYISTNGILILLHKMVGVRETLYYFQNHPFPIEGHVFIAPFYGDIDTRSEGIVWYSQTVITDSDLLKKAADHVQLTDFCPEHLLIATWDSVGYYDERNDKLNTFQCVIATDGNTTFAIFLYNKIEWTTAIGSIPAKVGFNDGVREVSWEMPCSGTENISMLTSSSNVGEPGVWIFQVDGTDIIPACPNEDNLTLCESDGLCSCLTEDTQQNCQCQNNTVCTIKDIFTTTISPGPINATSTVHIKEDVVTPTIINSGPINASSTVHIKEDVVTPIINNPGSINPTNSDRESTHKWPLVLHLLAVLAVPVLVLIMIGMIIFWRRRVNCDNGQSDNDDDTGREVTLVKILTQQAKGDSNSKGTSGSNVN